MMKLTCVMLLLLLPAVAAVTQPSKPNILMVIVDDFGWADAGWHRTTPSPEVVTPTMNELVQNGIELNRHYVHMMCTPTRSSFYSGRLPVHVLTQLANPCDKNGAIPRNMTGIGLVMKKGGYATHHVGKWDAGMATPTHTPKGRGFDTSLNYFGHGNWAWSEAEWGGSNNNRSILPVMPGNHGVIDFYDTDHPAKDLNGTGHEEYLFRDRIQSILQSHDKSQPLFLVYASKLCHYPLQAPEEYLEKFSFIKDDNNRKTYHAMVNLLDDQLANITGTMKNLGMWNNTLMVLSSDNGGFVKSENGGCQTMPFGGQPGEDLNHGIACYNGEAGANNFPLRAGKYSQFEGGIRVNAFVSGGLIPMNMRGTKTSEIIHIADWYHTFASLAGVDPTDTEAAKANLPPIDSIDMWPLITGKITTSPRSTILVTSSLLIHNQWKYCEGNMIEASWGGYQYPNASTVADNNYISNYQLKCPNGCLFDVASDMTEQEDVAAQNQDVVKMMSALMDQLKKSIYSVSHADDPACHAAAKESGFYAPWLP
eukprot:m.27570 g.27570  ORF g.27570 m.27570 type:complete len:537 (-) comp7908_c0_seq1:65-1675(-)